MAMDELTMLSFVGIYFLLLGNFVYSFYLSKKVYNLVGTVMEFVAYSTGAPEGTAEPAEAKIGTMQRLMQEGMELHDTPAEEPAKEEEIQPLIREETPVVTEAAAELEEEINPPPQEEIPPLIKEETPAVAEATSEAEEETEAEAQEEPEETDEEVKEKVQDRAAKLKEEVEEGEDREKKGLLKI